MIDVYESAIDHTGLWGAVFERDDDTAFFYLLDLKQNKTGQIIEAFNAQNVNAMPATTAVSIRWNTAGDYVGLFAEGSLLAIFDLNADGKKGRWATASDTVRFALN